MPALDSSNILAATNSTDKSSETPSPAEKPLQISSSSPMATANARLSAFTFNHSLHSTKLKRPNFIHCKPLINPQPQFQIKFYSVDVTKEDKPLSQTDELQNSAETLAEEVKEQKLDPRRLEEKFAVLNTGVYECRSCGYRYDESVGDPSYPIAPGLSFQKLPEDWRCPTCGAAQSFFESKSVEIAGFAQNQQYGLGGNTLTSEQKALLIYGSLLLGFLFFLGGYFLQ